MTHIVVKEVKNVTYRVKNEFTNNLPTQFSDICLDLPDEIKPTDFMIQNMVGMYIMNMTGYTPEHFVVDDRIPYGVKL